jgi:ankyrin repeat protein
MKKQLPERPDLEQLKKQAKDLLEAVHAGMPEALVRIGREERETFALNDAQRILAREYGFESWPKLKLHVETRTEEAAEARLIEAALNNDGETIRAILAERPGLRKRSIYVAAALGDAVNVKSWLAREAALVTAKGGPRGWTPLLYVCFGQCEGGDTGRTGIVRELLERGADANDHWTNQFWPEAKLPALYGASGVNNYPQVVRTLLRAGANPNDGESLFHAAELNHRASLDVLAEFEAELSAVNPFWGNSTLYFLLSLYNQKPETEGGIAWLLGHGANPNVACKPLGETPLHAAVRYDWKLQLIELLLRHGADPALRRDDGRTALALAVQTGREDAVQLLRRHGAADEVSMADQFLGACMRADAGESRRLLARRPDLVNALAPAERALVHEAAKRGRADALSLMGELGFDLEVPGVDGEHPLHAAALMGRAEAVRVLVRHGVNLNPRDKRFEGVPLGWCVHGAMNSRIPEGDYAGVAEALVSGGAEIPEGSLQYWAACSEVMTVVRRHLAEQNKNHN